MDIKILVLFISSFHGENPDQPATGYVEELFDGYAQRFEDHLLQQLHYQVPSLVNAVIKNRFTIQKPAREILILSSEQVCSTVG